METRTWTENGTPVSKEKTVAFSGHRTNRIAKFTADREKLFREVAFDTFAAIESYCIKKGYDTFLSGMCEGFDLIAAEEVLNLKKRYPHIRPARLPLHRLAPKWCRNAACRLGCTVRLVP